MAKKRKLSKDFMWVNPQWRFKGPDDHTRSDEGNITPKTGSRFLELADIALGPNQPIEIAPKKKAS